MTKSKDIVECIKNRTKHFVGLIEIQLKFKSEIREMYKQLEIERTTNKMNEILEKDKEVNKISTEIQYEKDKLNFLLKMFKFGKKHDFDDYETNEILIYMLEIYKRCDDHFTDINL